MASPFLSKRQFKDKTNRRCSDSHAMMVTSPEFEFCNNRNSSSKSEFEDPIRTEEYKQALNQFIARRSLGPSIPNSDCAKTPDSKKDNRKVQSEKKSKRRSEHSFKTDSSNVPEVQFMYGNQVFMPGAISLMNKKKNKKKKSDTEGSLMSTSPDLLPPRFWRNKQLDFDTDNDIQSSPPEFCNRNNSLPYVDKVDASYVENSIDNKKIDDSTMESKEDKNADSSLDDGELNKSNLTDTSFGSVARILEKMCQFENVPNYTYFRGVPLIKHSALEYKSDGKSNSHWHQANWMCMPVIVKDNPKSWCSPGQKVSLDDFSSKDLDILTKIRHPNILLLMGLYYDKNNKIQTFYEGCVGSLYEYIHEQGNVLSCQSSINYLGGIANALLHLKTNNYIHTNISSHTIHITSRNVAKLCDFELCTQVINLNPDKMMKKVIKKEKELPNEEYSSEPEYENLKNLNYSLAESYDPNLYHECAPQEISSRSIFSPFRWQAPELFDDFAGLVYPCKRTDVYSLCLVLWECCNNSIPWKTISYEQLEEMYFHWRTGIRLPKDDRYPKCVREILAGGLPVNPHKRIDIEDLTEKFKEASIILRDMEEVYVIKEKLKNLGCDSYDENIIGEFFKESLLNNSNHVPITNLDGSDLNLYGLSSSKTESSLHINRSNDDDEDNILEETMHNTNSTEYCSLMTPTVRRFMLNSVTSGMQSKLSFDEELFMENHNTAPEKIIKLNSIITPKSYKSLHIETPSSDKIDTIKSLTRSFELNHSDDKKSSYSFSIQNTSLPMTPIARNTKIRRNAWLSGDKSFTLDDLNNDVVDEKLKTNEDFKTHLNVEAIDVANQVELDWKKNMAEALDTKISTKVITRNKRRHSLINMKSDLGILNQNNNCANFSARNDFLQSQLNSDSTDNHMFRSRSFSLDNKSNNKLKSKENIMGVDIKPLVAIHEKWIMESKQKSMRLNSMSNNSVKGLSPSVKPASHLTDPLGPKNSSAQSTYDTDSKSSIKSNQLSETTSLIRQNCKKIIMYKKPADFFENSLWQKEKEKCMGSMNSNKCSTPKAQQHLESIHNCVDKFTNTDTFEELCKKIIDSKDSNLKPNIKTVNKPAVTKCENVKILKSSNDSTNFKDAKSQVLIELANAFEKRSKGSMEKQEKDVLSTTVTLESDNNVIKQNDVHDCFHSSLSDCDDEEDTISLPENFVQSDELVNKALKRCQAFTALQDARSTEDMYIDDELPGHMDIQNLIENIPFDSTLHEALCDKGKECCLIKIQEECQCDRLLIYCEQPHKNGRKSGSSCDSTDNKFNNLSVENLPNIDLIDLTSTNTLLPIIEERSGEEDSDFEEEIAKVGNGVQNLILMYENEKNKHNKNDSVFIIDENIADNNYYDLVDDIIHV